MALLQEGGDNVQLPAEHQVPTTEETRPDEQTTEGFTVSAEQIGREILQNAQPEQRQAIEQIVNAGMKLLFGDAHDQIFDAIKPDDEVPLADEIGVGAVGLMNLMFQESNGTMPQDAIVPAGAILIAKAMEFIHEGGMAPVTDEDYGDAFEIFTVKMQEQFDPEFAAAIGSEAGAAPQPAEAEPGAAGQGGLLQV